MITRLEERFTQYEMQQISDLSTGYAIRLYELLICWRTTGKTPIIELTDFRQKIGVLENTYQAMNDLKKRVLEPALKQVNEHTDITASYEQHKKGRTITGFSFKFKQKKPKQAEIAIETIQAPQKYFRHYKTPHRATDRKIQHDSVQIGQYFRPE